MTLKKITAVVLAAAVVCTAFTACSSKKDDTAATTEKIVEVKDEDDDTKMDLVESSQSTVEINDNQGNTLTLVPVYNSDGKTVIAGYIEKAVDKNGKELDEKSYSYLKSVIAITINPEGQGVITYTDDKKFITLDAQCDEKGYIVAIQDSIDVDGDKDTTEYFKVVTKIDANKNLFIKLDKDENGKLINVTVKKDSSGKTTVTDEKGNTQTTVDSKDSANLIEIVEQEKEKEESSTSGTGSSSSGSQSSGGSSQEETVDYTSIVLMDNGKVACDAKNVTVNEASALNGGSEIIVEGKGDHSKYYITSETSVFSGQIEFRFSVDESVEVKVYNVNMSTAKKTAIKFTNVDSESEKENDGEEQVGDNSQSGNELAVPVPQVEFSITGTNSFEASGSGKNGTIYSECRLGIKGHGSATIDGGQNLSGICSTESIDIKNATLDITSNAKQGISCDKKVTVKGGATINIESKGDGIHCNKFEIDPLDEGETDSVININSLSPADGADGIDANDYIIIGSGKLNIVASLTEGKRGLKVRKVENGKVDASNPPEDTDGKPDGFYINGGTVAALGSANSTLTKCNQKTVTAKSRKATTFTVGSVTSSGSNKSFICSPVSVNTVTSSSSSKAKDITWNGNIGAVSF